MSAAEASALRRWLTRPVVRRVLPIALSLAAFAYLFSIVDVHALSEAMRRVTASAWISAVLLGATSTSCGLVRWWLLFFAFGATHRPRLRELARHYAMGNFYNTCLPGGVSGDVVRGLATQHAFPEGSAGGFATVLVERVLGVSALLGLVAAATLLHPRLGLERYKMHVLVVFGLGIVAVVCIASFGKLARFIPAQRLRALIEKVPVPTAYLPLLFAWLLSLGCQITPALAGHVLLSTIHAPPSIFDSLAIVPFATAAAFLPFSVSGAGIRETIFVQLYAQVGVPAQASLAAALCLWAAQVFFAGLCGVYALVAQSAGSARDASV
jgi:uncharacterized membrane protein YbhN (UPF0104 family)